MNNKTIKYFLGFLLLGLILTSFYMSKFLLFLTCAFFIIIAMVEYRTMFKSKGIYPHAFLPEFSGILLSYIFIYYPNTIGITDIIVMVLILSFIMAFFITVITNKKPYFLVSMSTILAVVFIFCGLHIIKIFELTEKTFGMEVLLIYFLAVLIGDYSASKIGPLGKPYWLIKDVSPNKTIFGSVINVISSCLVCLVLKNEIPFLHCIFLGITISVFSQIGDLSLSAIKRDLGLKHSGNLFCDYGGIFDRIDAFIFSAPAVYFFLLFILF